MKPLPAPTTDTPTLEELEDALQRLTAETQGRWGKLDAPGMVQHCTRFIDLYQGRVRAPGAVRLAARLIGPMFLRRVVSKSPTETPRNLKTLGAIQVDPSSPEDLDERVAELRAGLTEIEQLSGQVHHPLYGETDAVSVQTLVRHHTAHHFHQFGLL